MPTGSTTRTIRIEDDLNNKIEKLAELEGTSVNFVVNSALREYMEWSTVCRKFGMGSFHIALVSRLLQNLSEEEAKKLGRWAARELFGPFVEYQFGKVSFQSFLGLVGRFGKYSGRFRYDQSEIDGQYIILLKHGSGRKWSLYYSGLLEVMCEDYLKMEPKIEITDDIMVAKIETRLKSQADLSITSR
jgi:hypothetical protein